MKPENLNGLVRRVKDGDNEAALDLHRVLRPVVSRQVRRILQAQEFASPLGQAVHGLLTEFGFASPDRAGSLETTASAITQRICRQTVSQLRAGTGEAACAAETVWAA